MKTPRQLARTCARRRCVLPIALCAAAAYLLLSPGRPPATTTSEQPTAARDQRPNPDSPTGHAGVLAKPRNDDKERDALAQHLAKMAASPAASEDTLAQVKALSAPSAPAAVAQPATTAHHLPTVPSEQQQPTTLPKAPLASAETRLQHDRDKTETRGHGDAGAATSSPPAAAKAPPASAPATASGPQPGPLSSPRVATFYYPWYGTPATDGKWAHWDHPQIEHWDTKRRDSYPHGEKTRRVPPGSIGSNFYPESGPYSSRDPTTVATHMRQIRQAGIGVVVVSWYPPGTQDVVQGGKEITVEDGVLMPLLLRCAEKEGLKVALHVEPYEGRNAATLRRDVEYASKAYGGHPAMQKHKGRIVYYLCLYTTPLKKPLWYDSYREPAKEWAKLFDPSGPLTVRNTDMDGAFLCLLLDRAHMQYAVDAHCDGYYTYFASPISWGSTPQNWKAADAFAADHSLIFAPSVGPGYIDTRVRPWNPQATKARTGHGYYDNEWKAAIAAHARWVGITSFNEWHEGTQIEPAARGKLDAAQNFAYRHHSSSLFIFATHLTFAKGAHIHRSSYEEYADGPDMYLDATRKWVQKFDPTMSAGPVPGPFSVVGGDGEGHG